MALLCAYGAAACSSSSDESPPPHQAPSDPTTPGDPADPLDAGGDASDAGPGDIGDAGDASDSGDAADAAPDGEVLEGVQTRVLIDKRAIASWKEPIPAGDPRPVVVFMPGWGGNGSVDASVSAMNARFVDEGYISLAVGFDSNAAWSSDLAASVAKGLDALCADATIPARCDAIALIGTSYGGSQNYWVTSHLRQHGYDGSAGREVIAFLSEDAGYAPPGNLTDPDVGTFVRTGLADASKYGVAMIENQGDLTFPIDACTWGNCGIRVLANAHKDAGDTQVLSKCPDGGSHGSRGYADWSAWVVSSIKTMIHEQRGVAAFQGYVGPTIAVGNDCL